MGQKILLPSIWGRESLGNVVSFLAGPNPGVGASGGVFGIVAAFGVYLLLNRKLLGQWVVNNLHRSVLSFRST
ncbi:MAG: hypothetical protein Ct9H300mP19_06730 [Dehalococcoidia bacterium]|nr:MAG: hypothetical protein Ct9H300mP19_06730 [Dehalococcoidia bacterium]